MTEKSSVFDMIGPVMIGPSSSHTAGVVRIGATVYKILGSQPERAMITFYNSFAQTYEGHGSDKAIIAGLMGFKTDDKRIRNSLNLAEEQGFSYKFQSIGNASTVHPNTVRIVAETSNSKVDVLGESRGGGVVRIKEVNGFAANFTTALNTLIIKANDKKGSIAFLTNVLSQDDCNIATMTVSRKGKNEDACQIIEMDSEIRETTLAYIKSLNWVNNVIYIPVVDI